MKILLTLPLLAVGLGIASRADANNVSVSSTVRAGRVLLVLHNNHPETPVALERVEVPTGMVRKRGGLVALDHRVIQQGLAIGEASTVDLGSVEQVFDGGGTAEESTAVLRSITTVGADRCLTRHTPVTVHMRLAGGSIRLLHGVPVSYCYPRADASR
ncbi:TPA: hypothetical protein ACOEBF_001314 [Stenotrophomonas maltophilia]|uniref:hypothetical protein n=1 Tax=Stenotrophomonas maltophilia TaxID=40324 RepID=UPI0021C57B58|nr:hypothetical protein [Stenotrophomonas maltophilia]MCU1124940.1 hypothetical protein [Stenotrophomonas maltophilia]